MSPVAAELAEALHRALGEAERQRGRLPGLLLAVSGGPDSLALLLAAARLRELRPGRAMAVASVDHALRPASAAEAAAVAALCRDLALPHRTLRWRRAGPPHGNLSAAAREARYALLADEARRIGAGILATAHHADDQRETVLLARERGARGAHLAGMRPWRDLDSGLVLLRPFLGLPKSALRHAVQDAGWSAADDPTNRDAAYGRVRWRERLRRDPDLARCADRERAAAAALREALDGALAAEIGARVRSGDVAFCGRGTILWRGGHSPTPALLSRFVTAAGGAAVPPPGAALARLALALGAASQGRATLAGCQVAWDAEALRFEREWGRAGIETRATGEGCADMFDRRFRLDPWNEAPPDAVWAGCGALGRGGAHDRTLPVLLGGDGAPLAVHPALARRFPALPVLRGGAVVGWRVWADLPGPAPAALTPRLHFAAKRQHPVGKDLAATYLP